MTRRQYTVEFKKEAARLMIIDGLSTGEVSEKLGVNTNVLYRWKKEHLEELQSTAKPTGSASPVEMAQEIERLRKQLRKSERINEILKKTVGYFAKDEQ
jgi:transposase